MFVEKALHPILDGGGAILKDTKHFLTTLCNWSNMDMHKEFYLVTMDIVSLFTMKPSDIGLDCVRSFLSEHSDYDSMKIHLICTLLDVIVCNNVFMFGDELYLQQVGVAMGTVCANSYVDMVMAKWEYENIFCHVNPFHKNILFYDLAGFY